MNGRPSGLALRILLVACGLLSVGLMRLGAAQNLPAPLLTAPVNDFAHVIDDETARELDRRIRSLQKATGDAIVVATVPTFQPYADIREYAVKMFENGGRGIGETGKDNGVLIVVAVQDRRVDIEVGYGLEEFITDGFAGETIRQAMTPHFRNGNYGAGLLAGTTRIVNRVAERRGVTLEDVPREPAPSSSPSRFPWWIVWLIVIMIAASRRRRRRGRHWGGGPWSGWNSGIGPFGGGGGFGGGFGGFGGGSGGGGGGFGGFGGGRSGGGGASGVW